MQEVLSRYIEPLIQQYADEAERHRRLSLPVVGDLTGAGLFRRCVPLALGGLEVAPLTFYRVVEAVARLSALQRSLRDAHAVTQHVGTAPQQYEDADRMMLDLESLQPLNTATVLIEEYVKAIEGRWCRRVVCMMPSGGYAAFLPHGAWPRVGARRCPLQEGPLYGARHH
jgi:hypothetical protein